MLNAGGKGSISGFTLDKATCCMESIDDSTVSLQQLPSADTATEFWASSPAQVDFTPNGEHLIVTIKGINGNYDGGGTINRFNVDRETGLTSDPPHVHETGTHSLVPMGFDFDEEGNLLLVDLLGNDSSESTLTVYNVVDTTITEGDRVELDVYGAGWVQYNNGCAFAANSDAYRISSVQVLEGGKLNLIKREEVSVDRPSEPRFSSDGRFMYVFSTGIGDVQPAIHVYETESTIERTCGLTEVQVISEGIPNAVTTVYGATGLAVF